MCEEVALDRLFGVHPAQHGGAGGRGLRALHCHGLHGDHASAILG